MRGAAAQLGACSMRRRLRMPPTHAAHPHPPLSTHTGGAPGCPGSTPPGSSCASRPPQFRDQARNEQRSGRRRCMADGMRAGLKLHGGRQAPSSQHKLFLRLTEPQCCYDLFDVRSDPSGCRDWQPGRCGSGPGGLLACAAQAAPAPAVCLSPQLARPSPTPNPQLGLPVCGWQVPVCLLVRPASSLSRVPPA